MISHELGEKDIEECVAMLESDLSKPVSDWLVAKGFTPYAEVPFPHDGPRTIDLVARNGQDLIAVELKRALTKAVIQQTYICDLITDLRYAAVGTRPTTKGIEQCRRSGVGLLSVRDGVVNVILNPKSTMDCSIRANYAIKIHAQLDRMEPHGIGGVPCLKGIGPAQECYDRVQAYRAQHPQAKWRDVFTSVDNHYSSVTSMIGAMSIVKETRRKRAKEEAERVRLTTGL